MEKCKVSIIMSCYNAQDTVARAIDSVLKQHIVTGSLL